MAQRDAIADSLWQKFGPGSALTFWKSLLAWLELTLPDGSTLTVANDRAITLDPPEDTDGLRPMTGGGPGGKTPTCWRRWAALTPTPSPGASHSWDRGHRRRSGAGTAPQHRPRQPDGQSGRRRPAGRLCHHRRGPGPGGGGLPGDFPGYGPGAAGGGAAT